MVESGFVYRMSFKVLCFGFLILLLPFLVFFLGPLRSAVARHVISARLCYHTSSSVHGFVSCFPLFSTTSQDPATINGPKGTSPEVTKKLPNDAIKPENGDNDIKSWKPTITLLWCAPFFSGGGYSSEAISYISELQGLIQLAIVQHGDSFSEKFVKGLPATLRVRNFMFASFQTQCYKL